MEYKDFSIEAFGLTREVDQDDNVSLRFKVRVSGSPAGEIPIDKAAEVQYNATEIKDWIGKLEARELTQKGLVALGRSLAALMLPPDKGTAEKSARDLLADSLLVVGQDGGLRLRLRLPPALAELPWEYMYVDRTGGGDGIDGFVALDPRTVIVRHEEATAPARLPLLKGDLKVVAAFASKANLPPLALDDEIKVVADVLADRPGVVLDIKKDATFDDVLSALHGASIFHFAGHGVATRETASQPGSYTLTGSLAFTDRMVDAKDLNITLQGEGLRLVVLGGCETGRRGGIYIWGGIAPTLGIKGEVPAVVANQFSIKNDCAIAFAKGFYQALIGGLSLEYAVACGRKSAYEKDPKDRDWGVPVLYLRASDGILFEGAADTAVRQQARAAAEADVDIRVREVAASGILRGAEIGAMLGGNLAINIVVTGTAYGPVIGYEGEHFVAGNLSVKASADEVKDKFTGVKLKSFGPGANH